MPLRSRLNASRAVAALSVAVAVAASLVAARTLGMALGLGALSQHMLEHIALLGAAAPVSAWLLRDHLPPITGRGLAAAAAVQIALIWMWHLPPVFAAAQAHPAAHLAMSVSLFAAGLFFWSAIVALAAPARWQAILGLLVTGKLFCLFAAVLVFSPRLLYDLAGSHVHHVHGAHAVSTSLADQQLAGLIMIAVCPLTYVAAGIVIAARWLVDLEVAHPDIRRGSVLRSPLIVMALLLLLSGCSDVQSALDPASLEASQALRLTWLLFVGAAAIFALVMALLALAALGGSRLRALLDNNHAVLVGGVAFPAVVLTLLLAYGLWLASSETAEARAPQEIAVQGERWWWRVTYKDADAKTFATANEIRVAAGRPVRLELSSPDVIHSFWVPALAGKVDLIPGRTNTLSFTPTKTGTYRGQCAEYCGGPHAMMALRVIVMDPEEHVTWTEAQRRPATPPANVDGKAARGQEVFMSACVACHAVRGTTAAGRLGPDLTHVASREAIGGEVLPMSEENISRWLTDNDRLKPNNLMPEYRHLSEADLDALVAYLASLK